MLARISCQACHLSSLWTDDPKGFLQDVCPHYRSCAATLSVECLPERKPARAAKHPSRLVPLGPALVAYGRRPRSVR